MPKNEKQTTRYYTIVFPDSLKNRVPFPDTFRGCGIPGWGTDIRTDGFSRDDYQAHVIDGVLNELLPWLVDRMPGKSPVTPEEFRCVLVYETEVQGGSCRMRQSDRQAFRDFRPGTNTKRRKAMKQYIVTSQYGEPSTVIEIEILDQPVDIRAAFQSALRDFLESGTAEADNAISASGSAFNWGDAALWLTDRYTRPHGFVIASACNAEQTVDHDEVLYKKET